MLIAQEKRKNNIAEYILYIWQLEDLIRAFNFDMKNISTALASQFDVDADTQIDIYEYYKNLVLMMQKERVTEKGHIQAITNVVNELNEFHLLLLKQAKDPHYIGLFQLAKPIIDEFRLKSNNIDGNDIENSLQSLYTLMLLKLQKKEISKGTTEANKHISNMLARLSALYKRYESKPEDF